MPPKIIVWRFFEKASEGNAICKLCKKILKTAGNTSNLMCHIRNVHKDTYHAITKNQNSEKKTVEKEVLGDSQKMTETAAKSVRTPKSPSTGASSGTPFYSPSSRPQSTDVHSQPSIVSSFDNANAFSSSGEKTLRVNEALMYIICKDYQQFSIVENEGFRHLQKIVAPRYKIPCRSTLTKWVDAKYDELAFIFRDKIAFVENATLDVKSFLGITAHFGVDVQFHSVTLEVYELDERHTSEYIAEKLLKACVEWKVETDKVSAVIIDNAASMVKAIDLAFGKKKHVPCFAHTLNLVAESAIQYTSANIIVKKIKESHLLQTELHC
ncbi:zinc finger BED domain-containing protein 4-like [Rhagoletis pomonella]|uniref:zinc finger BED domain-containing protein 4-like n=1 Tax=Rhagoletis pomonella TaxID=28610 RepID=UPI00178590BC|nr:zinc finger BED domain-containing protein 4-like [Rhagoletis pomonella]